MCNRIHPIRIDFQVTPTVQRYVYLYLIIGTEGCYLVDSGVCGAEQAVVQHLAALGRSAADLRAVFLTHAHPDHIGSAAALKDLSGCRVYASPGEAAWIENIDLQWKERPIPNFYSLVNRSVALDGTMSDGDTVQLEPGLTIQAVSTPGHSCDQLSYLLAQESCLFTGDAIPVKGDIPIWVDAAAASASLQRLQTFEKVNTFYPAWDVPYARAQAMQKISDALDWMEQLQQCVTASKVHAADLTAIVRRTCEQMNTPHFLENPLFQQTIASML